MVQGISNSNKMTLSSEKTESDIPTESYSVNRYLNKCQLTPESIKKLAEKLDILKKISSLKDNITSHNDEQDLQEDKTPENYEGLLLSHRYLLSSGGSKTKKISLDINIKKGFNSLYIGREEKEELKALSASNRAAGVQLVDAVSRQYRRSRKNN